MNARSRLAKSIPLRISPWKGRPAALGHYFCSDSESEIRRPRSYTLAIIARSMAKARDDKGQKKRRGKANRASAHNGRVWRAGEERKEGSLEKNIGYILRAISPFFFAGTARRRPAWEHSSLSYAPFFFSSFFFPH